MQETAGTRLPGQQTNAVPLRASPGGWFNCSVNFACPADDGVIYIHLREEGGQFDRWYKAYDGMKREMLATALTAITTGLPVLVFL